MLAEYLYVFIYFGVSALLSIIIIILSVVAAVRNPEIEKVSAYECGFHPFEDSRGQFEVRFYLVAILFIIFDLEIMFLYPWIVVYYELSLYAFSLMLLFLFILLLGFVYEWKKGALDWE